MFASPAVSPGILGHELVHVAQARREPSVRVTLEPTRRDAAEQEAARPPGAPYARADFVHYYGEAGHFYTAYLVALAVGFDDRTAFRRSRSTRRCPTRSPSSTRRIWRSNPSGRC